MGQKGSAVSAADERAAPVEARPASASSVDLRQSRGSAAYTVPVAEWCALDTMLKAMCLAVPAPRAYCLLKLPNWRFPTGCLVDGERALAFRLGAELAESFPWPDFGMLDSGYVHLDLAAGDGGASNERGVLELVERGVGHEMSVSLEDAAGSLGLLVLQRRWSEAPFSAPERGRLETLAPFVSGIASLQAARVDARCESALQRALGQGTGAPWLIDGIAKEVVWAPASSRGNVAPSLSTIEQLLASGDEHSGSAGTAFSSRGVAVRMLETGQADTEQGLSARERAVARLLVGGYEAINIAANLGIAENTVRTYIRRLYRKLGAHNRADLVRILLASDAG